MNRTLDHLNQMKTFPSVDAMNQRLADVMAQDISNATNGRSKATVAVSGGRTPHCLFQKLSHKKLRWEQVDITLADERWVSTESQDSNEFLVRSKLLQNQAKKANFLGLKNVEPCPQNGEELTEKVLKQIDRPFDIMLLGTGEDGHLASIFPNCSKIYSLSTVLPSKVDNFFYYNR